MSQRRRPKKGSRGYSPRKRSQSHTPHNSSWPINSSSEPKIQGFAGYKAGMTHIISTELNEKKTTFQMKVQTPVTILEVPPIKIAAIRYYQITDYGKKTLTEIWHSDFVKESSKINTNKKIDFQNVTDISVLAHTQPKKIKSIPKKVHDTIEIRIDGSTIKEQNDYALKILGKEITVYDFTKEGKYVDVISITKGKGFQGATKRFGIKLLSHKNSKHRRGVATLGPKRPGYVRPTVPSSGQTGFHQRTEVNKKIVKIGKDGVEITPKGGFVNYGEVKGDYILIKGSIPGPVKRLIKLRDPIRLLSKTDTTPFKIDYISIESKQGG